MKRLGTVMCVLVSIGLMGCTSATFQAKQAKPHHMSAFMSFPESPVYPVAQIGRYRSVSTAATRAQKNPLLAIAQFRFASRVKTVGQALRQVLQETGYALVPTHQLPTAAKQMLQKPLPVTQRELGPIVLRNALTTLMGETVFTLRVDPLHRRITFRLKPSFSGVAWGENA